MVEPLDGFAQEDEHVGGGQLVRVGEELGEEGDHRGRYVLELDGARVERAHQQLTVPGGQTDIRGDGAADGT